jgi:hypothetical protein
VAARTDEEAAELDGQFLKRLTWSAHVQAGQGVPAQCNLQLVPPQLDLAEERLVRLAMED